MNTTPETYRVLSRGEAATYLNISTRTLDRLHILGEGPGQIRLSRRRIGYRACDLDDWLQAQRETRRAA